MGGRVAAPCLVSMCRMCTDWLAWVQWGSSEDRAQPCTGASSDHVLPDRCGRQWPLAHPLPGLGCHQSGTAVCGGAAVHQGSTSKGSTSRQHHTGAWGPNLHPAWLMYTANHFSNECYALPTPRCSSSHQGPHSLVPASQGPSQCSSLPCSCRPLRRICAYVLLSRCPAATQLPLSCCALLAGAISLCEVTLHQLVQSEL